MRSFQVLVEKDVGEAVPVWLPKTEMAGPGPVMIRVEPFVEVMDAAPCLPSWRVSGRLIR